MPDPRPPEERVEREPPEPMRVVVKEWGEAVDVWMKNVVRASYLCFGLFGGTAIIDLLEKAL
jgi:hypothetical protein